MALLGNLVVNLLADTKKFDESMKKSMDKMKSIGKNLTNVGKKMSLFATGPLVAIGIAAIKSSGDIEKQRVALETLLGSVEEARILLDDLVTFAAKTPFQLPGLIDNTKQLLAFGIANDEVLEKMEILGNAAQGDQEILNRLTYAYGVLRARGTATMEQINMFIQAGVPIMRELADATGVTQAELVVMLRQGKISFDLVDQALVNLTTGTGQFAGMIEKQSQTMIGLVSTLKDNLGILSRSFADMLLPHITKFIEKLIALVQRFTEMDDRTKKIIMVVAGVVAVIGPLILIAGQLAMALSALLPVIIAVNAAMAANPIGLIVIAVAALATGAILLIKNWDKVKEFFVGLWETMLKGWSKIKDFFIKLWSTFKGLLDKVPNWVLIMMPFVGLPLLIIKNWEQIKDFMINLMNVIKEQLVDKLLGIVDKVKESVEKVTGFFKDMFEKVSKKSYVPEMVDEIEIQFNRMNDVMVTKAEEATTQTKSMFEMLNDYMENSFQPNFVSTMESVWTQSGSIQKKMKEMIKGMVADLLKALGRQYAALAAAMWITLQFGQAIKYTAAAAALFSAAGVVSRLQKGGIAVKETLAVVGEKGQEAVIPLSQEGLQPFAEAIVNEMKNLKPSVSTRTIEKTGSIVLHNYFQVGNEVLYKTVQRGMDNKQIRVNAKAIR